jgi:hypothetical protein
VAAVAGDALVGVDLGYVSSAVGTWLAALAVNLQEVPDFHVYVVTHAVPQHIHSF